MAMKQPALETSDLARHKRFVPFSEILIQIMVDFFSHFEKTDAGWLKICRHLRSRLASQKLGDNRPGILEKFFFGFHYEDLVNISETLSKIYFAIPDELPDESPIDANLRLEIMIDYFETLIAETPIGIRKKLSHSDWETLKIFKISKRLDAKDGKRLALELKCRRKRERAAFKQFSNIIAIALARNLSTGREDSITLHCQIIPWCEELIKFGVEEAFLELDPVIASRCSAFLDNLRGDFEESSPTNDLITVTADYFASLESLADIKQSIRQRYDNRKK